MKTRLALLMTVALIAGAVPVRAADEKPAARTNSLGMKFVPVATWSSVSGRRG